MTEQKAAGDELGVLDRPADPGGARRAGLFDNLPGRRENRCQTWAANTILSGGSSSSCSGSRSPSLPPSLEVLRKVESEMAAVWQARRRGQGQVLESWR